MNATRCILFTVGLFCACIAYAETEDPLGDFLSRRSGDVKDDDTLIMFRVDLNSDGTPEVFLTREKDTNSRLGNIWRVYISRGSKFLRCDELISLDHESLVLKKFAATGRYRLFSVTSPQKGQLLLMEFLVSKTAITSKKIAKIELLSEADDLDATIELLKDTDQGVAQITKGKAQDLKKSMSAQPKRK